MGAEVAERVGDMRCLLLVCCLAACADNPDDPYDGYVDDMGFPRPPGPKCIELKQLPLIVVPVGQQPRGIVARTYIDGSGPSLVVANTASNSIHVIRQSGSETNFVATEVAVGAAPVAVAAADVDHNLATDLLVTNSGDDTVTFLRNRGYGTDMTYAGQARLDPPVSLPVGSHPIAIAQLYKLHPNFAVANRDDDTVTILVNDGAGNFTAGNTIAVGNEPVAIISANLDGDFHQDLVVVHQADDTIGVLLNSGDDVTFGPMKTYATGDAPVAASATWDDDLWVANSGSNDVSAFLQLGGGDYAPQVRTPTVGSPRAVIHDGYGKTFVLDHDNSVVRVLETGAERAVGPDATSLAVLTLLGIDDLAVTNTASGTVSISTRECVYEP